MNLLLCGINFKTSELALREKLSFSAAQVPKALETITDNIPGSEGMLVSTCNRTELYIATPDHEETQERILKLFSQAAGIELDKKAASHFYFKKSTEAAKHLTAVASSLDSMVVGETEIMGQVKQAYAIAGKTLTECKFIHRLMNQVIRISKRVHSETNINRGRVSVSSISVEFARKVFEHLDDKTAMIVGAGETSELTIKSLISKGIKSVIVCNRSPEKGKALAERYGGEAIDYDHLDKYLPKVDIVVSSTSAPHCVIKAESVKNAVSLRHKRPMLLIDIAVPRDIEEQVGLLEDVYLYDIDDLQKIAHENLTRRKEAIDEAWSFIDEELPSLSKIINP